MKTMLILLLLCVTLYPATSISMQETKSKNFHKTYNHLQTIHKPSFHYSQPQQQQQQQQFYYQPQYVPVQMMAKTAYVPQQQTQQLPAMIIITAQPTPTYSAPVQQLLNFFQTNPQARQQLLYGNQPQAAPSAGSYVVAAAPTQYYTPAPTATQYYAAPAQYYATPTAQQETPQHFQLHQIAEMAQLTAQKLYGGQLKAATPIVTGLEHFTPEQQAQIKARLNDVISQDQAKYVQQEQPQPHHQQQMSDFVPSPQIKAEEGGVAYVGGSGIGQQNYSTKVAMK